MNPGGRAGHWKMNTFEYFWYWERPDFFETFLSVSYEITREKIGKSIFEFTKNI